MVLILTLLCTVLVLGIILVQVYLDRKQLRRALHRYDSLVSQEGFQERLALDIHLKQRELISLSEEQERLRQKLNKLISQEEMEEWLSSTICSKQEELAGLTSEQDQLSASVTSLRQQVSNLREEEFLQSFGFYQPKYDFITAGNYVSQLDRIKLKQKRMVLNKEIAIFHLPSTLRSGEGELLKKSERVERKTIDSLLDLISNIFHTELENLISKKVKYNSNINQVEEKIKKHFLKLNKIFEVVNCKISEKYLDLKLQELHLRYQVACEKQTEREREQAINEERQEGQKLEKIMKAAEAAEERENYYQQKLENALQEKDLVTEMEKEKLELQIQKLRQDLSKATSDREKASSAAASFKEGYVYIVSNIGSFGPDVYRICKTSKLHAPYEYISIMNRAVPFPFDVHFKFLSEDASDTLKRLHQVFYNKRVNIVNERREFFRVTLEEIYEAVEQIRNETGALKNIEFEKAPQAYEYRRTLASERRSETPSPENEIA